MSNRYGPRIVTDGLVCCLDAADRNSYPGTGSIWHDLSGQANNGTFVGSPTYSSDNGGSIIFNGSNYTSLNSSSTLNPNSGVTICVWLMFDSSAIGARNLIVGKGNGQTASTTQFWIEKDGSNKFRTWLGTNGGSTNYPVGVVSAVANTWYYTCMSYDGSALIGYFDGTTQTSSVSGPVTTTSFDLSVGRMGTFTGSYFKGKIPLFQMYNRGLTVSELNQNRNATKGRFGL